MQGMTAEEALGAAFSKIKKSGGGSGGNTNKYSTEETVIGEWIDGKAIYRQVITAITPGATTKEYAVATYEADIDDLVNLYGQIDMGGRFLPIEYCYDSTHTIASYLEKSSKSIFMRVAQNGYCNMPVVFIIEYTKTID